MFLRPENASGEGTFGYPGLGCVEADAVSSPNVYYGGGTARNNSTTTTIGLRCPVLKNTGIADLFDPNVYVNDASTTESLSCYARSCGPLGTSCSSSPTDSTGVSFTGNDILINNDFVPTATGIVYFFCSIPKKVGSSMSGVWSYSWYDL
jgi:hypothetical protein